MCCAVRKYAYQKCANLKIFTGTQGQLSVGKPEIPISLATKMTGSDTITNDLIPVPLHFWKLVYSLTQNAAIIFVVVNDPQLNWTTDSVESTNQQYNSLCPNDDPRLCEHEGWNIAQNTNIHQGFIYCCTVGSFNEMLSWIPQHANIPDNVDILSILSIGSKK